MITSQAFGASRISLGFGISASVETITPHLAADLLKLNIKNRKISLSVVKRYKKSITSGFWNVNGSTIVFNDKGLLIDGQQRLTACMQGGKEFRTIVIWGCDEEAFKTIDSGKRRSASDTLSIEGHPNARTLSAAVRWANSISSGNGANGPAVMETSEISAYVTANPNIIAALEGVKRVEGILAGSIATSLKFLFMQKDEGAARKFFSDLACPSGLAGDEAVWMLERRLSRNIIKKEKLPSEEIVALVIRAWNHRRGGEKTSQLKGLIRRSDGSATMPEII